LREITRIDQLIDQLRRKGGRKQSKKRTKKGGNKQIKKGKPKKIKRSKRNTSVIFLIGMKLLQERFMLHLI